MMVLRRCACIVVLLVAFMHLSCGKQPSSSYPLPEVDNQKLEEVLASRQQDNPPPLTLLEGYQIALARAREWDRGAYVTLMKGSFPDGDGPYQYNFGAYGTSGIGCLKLDEGVYWCYIRVNKHSGEIEHFKSEGISGVNTAPVDDIDNWVLDSPEAIEIAEANGGKAFKEKYPNCRQGFGVQGEVDLWGVSYLVSEPREDDGENWLARFEIVIDPYDGSFRIIEDTDGVSGKVIE